MRFLVDMALAPRVATWLVEQGHDAVHASAIGLHRTPDPDIIDRARIDDRIIVTADLDYPRLLALARAERPGLILFRGGQYTDAQVIERLGRAIETVTADELRTSVASSKPAESAAGDSPFASRSRERGDGASLVALLLGLLDDREIHKCVHHDLDNVVAIAQSNIKRMLADSSIAWSTAAASDSPSC